jgi:hypothetical protein
MEFINYDVLLHILAFVSEDDWFMCKHVNRMFWYTVSYLIYYRYNNAFPRWKMSMVINMLIDQKRVDALWELVVTRIIPPLSLREVPVFETFITYLKRRYYLDYGPHALSANKLTTFMASFLALDFAYHPEMLESAIQTKNFPMIATIYYKHPEKMALTVQDGYLIDILVSSAPYEITSHIVGQSTGAVRLIFCKCAIAQGQVEVLFRLMHDHNFSFDEKELCHIAKALAEIGDLQTIDGLQSLLRGYTYYILRVATNHDHLHIIDYYHSKGHPIPFAVLRMAILYNNLRIVKYLHERGIFVLNDLDIKRKINKCVFNTKNYPCNNEVLHSLERNPLIHYLCKKGAISLTGIIIDACKNPREEMPASVQEICRSRKIPISNKIRKLYYKNKIPFIKNCDQHRSWPIRRCRQMGLLKNKPEVQAWIQKDIEKLGGGMYYTTNI